MAKVLLVDDDMTMVQMVSEILRADGHEVAPFSNSKTALDAIEGVEHFLELLVDGDLVITPGDRSDVLMATLAESAHADSKPAAACAGAQASSSATLSQSLGSMYNVVDQIGARELWNDGEIGRAHV